MQITEKEAIKRYREHHRVSLMRQMWFGGRTVPRNFALRPCPRCHGNDRIEEVREAPGFVQAWCSRCDKDYLG